MNEEIIILNMWKEAYREGDNLMQSVGYFYELVTKKTKEEEKKDNIGKSFLTFEPKEKYPNEYLIFNKKRECLGTIWKHRWLWRCSPHLSMEEKDLWFADGCMFQIAYFLKKLKEDK